MRLRTCYTPAMRIRRLFPASLLVLTLVAPAVLAAQAHHAHPRRSAAAPTGTLAERIQRIVSAPDVAQDHFGISVSTLDGKQIYGMEDARLFMPASNAKLVTTAAAFALLPVNSLTWTTNIVADGPVDATGTLHGNLILLGVGDPTLSNRIYPYHEPDAAGPDTQKARTMAVLELLAQQVVQSGVRAIDGNVIGDDSYFLSEPYGTSWSWDDLQWDYGAPASALTFNDNTVDLEFLPDAGASSGLLPVWNPPIDYYTLESTVTAAPEGQQAHPGLSHMPGSLLVRAWGTAPRQGLETALAVNDPAEYTALAFDRALEQTGIQVKGTSTSAHRLPNDTGDFSAERNQHLILSPVTLSTVEAPLNGRRVLATHVSIPVDQDIQLTNKISQNLHAELLLRLLGKLCGSDGSLEQGTRVVRQFLNDAGIPNDEFFFYDGSGMSMDDRIAPRALTQLLAYASRQPWGTQWQQTFPIAGEDGTLVHRFLHSPLKGRLWAKTGTLNETASLSGYLRADSGKMIAFSILVNGHLPGDEAHRQAVERICEAIAASE
ncbi:MAG TPA: D-alanyl-D-alanine carboxypeptidase/D-alanyl-D-alanine-endopeptidase [Terracidiphilus sp.]|nr:D-alanyl-D-alanine carboxypeptidase/D-alanyl-D-alanine-endopeptidase [Terracidiphilus sp.]